MKKIISIIILVITFISFGILNVKALDYNNQIKFNYRYSREINNSCYWISSSASGFTNSINNAAHEMGHALGLAHWNSNPYSIMAQSSTRIVQVVQSIDNQHLNEKY